MIWLDANFLIGGVIDAPPESQHLLAWAAAGETFCKATPAISQQAPLATLGPNLALAVYVVDVPCNVSDLIANLE